MFGRRFFGAHFFGPRYWGDGGAGAATPVSTHRAQYAGIRAAKLKKKKKAQQAPVPEPETEKITVFGQAVLVDRHRDRVHARGTVRIPGRAVLADNSACDCLRASGTVRAKATARLVDSGEYTFSAVGTVRTDEEEALERLFEFMPQLRGMKIKITEDA